LIERQPLLDSRLPWTIDNGQGNEHPSADGE
jgi:hypothetical protein